jgi:hypothetical protein
MKIHGKEVKTKLTSKVYFQLDDLDDLYARLQVKPMSEVAKDLGVKPNCIRFRVKRYFPAEWQATIKQGRKYHTNKKREN